MFVTFTPETSNKQKLNCSFEIAETEYFYENEHYLLFIDSNLPLDQITAIANDTVKSNFHRLEAYIRQDGVLLAFDKLNNQIHVSRDNAGLCSIYYLNTGSELIFSSNQHAIAEQKKLPLQKSAVMQWLSFDFLWDGQTLYKNLSQVLVDQKLVFNGDLKLIGNECEEIKFADAENKETELQNIKKLRAEIVQAHSIYPRENNIVFLSGGIDSVAMLIALDDLLPKNKLENHSFRVKSTLQDETEYAASIANHLNINLKIIERDLSGEISQEQFIQRVKNLNNPYPGVWIFANQITSDKKNIYYAGQDTRLHTPSLNAVDKIAFKFFEATKGLKILKMTADLLMRPFRLILTQLTKHNLFKKRFFIGLKRFSYITNTELYILQYYFKLDIDYLKEMGLPAGFFESSGKSYQVDLSGIKSARALYNYIVALKWREQYVNDIRYMVDMVKDQGGRLAMPFYNRRLTAFSSTIPFEMANKSIDGKGPFSDDRITINKFVLREALRDKIDDKTYYRAKAVSSTFHIIFNMALTDILRALINKDLLSPNSVIVQLGLTDFVKKFNTQTAAFDMEDGSYLLKIYNLCCLVIYAEPSGNKID